MGRRAVCLTRLLILTELGIIKPVHQKSRQRFFSVHSKFNEVVTPHAQRERGKVIGRGVHIYICGRKKNLNRTLEIDSPFQTLIVGLLVEFID